MTKLNEVLDGIVIQEKLINPLKICYYQLTGRCFYFYTDNCGLSAFQMYCVEYAEQLSDIKKETKYIIFYKQTKIEVETIEKLIFTINNIIACEHFSSKNFKKNKWGGIKNVY